MSDKTEIGFQIPGTVLYVEVTQSPESIFIRVFDLSTEVEIWREMMPKIGVVPPPEDLQNRSDFDLGT